MVSLAKFETHYYLGDDIHSMDASVRNKCEAELLSIAYEIIQILDFQIHIEAQAIEEGGLRDIWKLLGDNQAQISLLISVLAIAIALSNSLGGVDADKVNKLNELSIEEKELQIKKLKKELSEDTDLADSAEKVAKLVGQEPRIVVRRSNYYKSISKVQKVNKVGFSKLTVDDLRVGDERIVLREDFDKYILLSQGLEPQTDGEAHIELVSPVLNNGRAKWRGIYNGEPINFSMSDKEFKRSVLKGVVSFKNGTILVCNLIIYAKLDEFGDKVITDYKVDTFIEQRDGGVTVQTPQGRSLRHERQIKKDQYKMFPNE